MTQISVVIVDPHHLVRAGFSLILQSVDGVRVLAECDSTEQAIDAIERQHPNLVLVSAKLGAESGLELTRSIRALETEQPRILVMVGSRDGDLQDAARDAGANGIVGKYATPDEIVDAVRDVMTA